MNRSIRIFISFVLPFFCLLISVSYAFEFGDNPLAIRGTEENTDNVDVLCGYSKSEISHLYSNRISELDSYNEMLNNFSKQGYHIFFITSYFVVFPKANFNDAGLWFDNSTKTYKYILYYDVDTTYYQYSYTSNDIISKKITGSGYFMFSHFVEGAWGNLPHLKILTYNSGFLWDGETYQYKSEILPEGDTISLPSNSEIASTVQAFYNTDYYKNNKDFEDFIVMYNYNTKYFSFIGHKHGSNLGQVIVPPGYEYEGNSYDDDWWKFFLRNISSEISSNLWNRYYWLYSTNDLGKTFTYNGKGAISDLLNLHFATSSIIVYSTIDYPVVKIETNEETGALEPVQGTVPGDQYTYDENLDPTTNEYNPLQNFVPTNPIQDILGDVDFEEINKTFEENKDILNIEGASWLFTANNNFISYFIGFLSLLIVFLLISRILGG